MTATRSDVVRRAAVPAVGLLVLIVGIAAGWRIASWRGAPGDDSAEAGFARDMATHHAQAVDMSFTLLDKSADGELRTLASDIRAADYNVRPALRRLFRSEHFYDPANLSRQIKSPAELVVGASDLVLGTLK